jgi:hypothetical protein
LLKQPLTNARGVPDPFNHLIPEILLGPDHLPQSWFEFPELFIGPNRSVQLFAIATLETPCNLVGTFGDAEQGLGAQERIAFAAARYPLPTPGWCIRWPTGVVERDRGDVINRFAGSTTINAI